MSKIAEKIELAETEEDRVFRWRYETLLRRGLSDLEATAVAASGFDLHRAGEMLTAGCSPADLAEIAS